MSKTNITIVTGLTLWMLIAASGYYFLKDTSHRRDAVREAGSVADIPDVGQHFKSLVASDIQYVRIRAYRYDEYLLTGRTNAESLELLASENPYLSLYKQSHDQLPSGDIERAIREFAGDSRNVWSNKNWTLRGNLNENIFISLGFDPATGKFWSAVRVQRIKT